MSGLEVVGDFQQYIKTPSRVTCGMNKRRKLDPPSTKFTPGNILSVRVWNFTTYEYAEFNLSPSLNMIIGPNGAGKSTLVAAICMGLGGKVDLIKRKSVKSMIKTGQVKSAIELSLQNFENEPPVVIKREFSEKESTWKINNTITNERSIKDLRKKFNIQLDNPCHFLPQEKVAEFASMSHEKLLLETERTLGDGHLLEMHERLIKLDGSSQEVHRKIEEVSGNLERLKSERESLENEAKKFAEYESKVEELKLHEKLIPYAQLEDLKHQRRHIKRQRDDARRSLERFSNDISPIFEQLEEAKRKLSKEEAETGSILGTYNELESIASQERGKLEELHEKIDQLQATSRTLYSRGGDKSKELETLRKSKSDAIRKKNNMKLPSEEELNTVKAKRNSKHSVIIGIQEQLETLKDRAVPLVTALKRLKHQITTQEHAISSTDKLSIIRPNPKYINRLRDDTYGGHVALRDKGTFKYFEAPVISCDVTDKSYARYLEKVIDNNTLFAITFTSQDEYKKVSDFILLRYNIPMRVINEVTEPRTQYSKSELNLLGFEGYLSNYITGPKEVMSMLYSNSKIDLIPVSRRGLNESQIRNLTQPDSKGRIRFKRFISDDTLFIIHQSQYGSKQFFYSSEKINPRSLYFAASGLSLQAKNDLKTEVDLYKKEYEIAKEKYESIQQQANEAKENASRENEELQNLKRQLDILKQQKSQALKLDAAINEKENQIEKVERQAREDYSDKIKQINEKIKEKYSSSALLMQQLANNAAKLSTCAVELSHKELLCIEIKNRVLTIEKLGLELEEHRKELVETFEEAKRRYDEIKLSDAANKIREQSRLYSVEEREALSNLVSSYLENGVFTEALMKEKVQLLEDEKSLMATADRSSVENLKRILEKIQNIERDLPLMIAEAEYIDTEIMNIRNTWEPELSSLITKISMAFHKRFTKVASDGRIELATNDRFKDWKLHILVKFRQESELRVLDHQIQSGGERAVSIIFFIMSLQGLSYAPFRVVDEINQGMDPKNERMAHKYLVHTACSRPTSQYFLITPKLLTGLYYHPDMLVHCIYTGPLMDPMDSLLRKPDFMDFSRLISA